VTGKVAGVQWEWAAQRKLQVVASWRQVERLLPDVDRDLRQREA